MTWINVKQQKPSDDQYILTTDGEFYHVAKYEDGQFNMDYPEYVKLKDVTHWMAFPFINLEK